MLGSRSPEKLADWVSAQGASAAAGTFEEAAGHGELLVVAVRGDAAESVVGSVGAAAFAAKVVIDATNPLAFDGDGPPGLFVGADDSMGERLQRKLAKARVVKCFNTVSYAQMVDPSFGGGVPEMLICGNDAEAKAAVTDVVMSFGWPGTLDAGGIEGARWLEALVPLWVRVGAVLGAWGHAWKVVRDLWAVWVACAMPARRRLRYGSQNLYSGVVFPAPIRPGFFHAFRAWETAPP